MLNALGLFEKEGQILVSSVDVAENFEKRHKNVIQSIENIRKSDKGFTELNFQPSEYEDSSGRVLPSYLMTRDGFTLLVMGFTGYKAQEWKIKYIKAFNAMEEKLKKHAGVSELPTQSAEIQRIVPYAEMFGPDSEYNKLPPDKRILQAALAVVNMPELAAPENLVLINGKTPFGWEVRRMASYANWLAASNANVCLHSLVEMAHASKYSGSFKAVILKYKRQGKKAQLEKGEEAFELSLERSTFSPVSYEQEYKDLVRKYEIERKKAATAIGNLRASRSNEEKLRHQLNKALDVIAKMASK